MRSSTRTRCLLGVVLGLSGCGGGGGSNDSPFVAPSPAATAEGLYNALTLTNRVVKWLVLDDGAYYLFYSSVGKTNDFAGVVQGTATSNGSRLTSTNARDFNFEGQGVKPASASADFSSRKSIDGTATFAGASTPLSGSYDAAYESTATLSALAGTYAGVIAATAGVQPGAVTISGSGTVTGVWFGCVVTGNVTPRSRGNAYDLTFSFSNLLSCKLSGQDFKGVGYLDAGNRRLFAAAPNLARSDSLLFVGQRP